METNRRAIELRGPTRYELPLLVELVGELAEYEGRRHEVLLNVADLGEALFGPRPWCEALLALVGGEAAGFAIWFYSFSTFRGRPNLYIEDLFVRPDFRRGGVGRAIFKRLAQIAGRRKCGRVEWSVLEWNEPAIAFYHSLGAQPVAEWKVFQLGGAALARLAGDPASP
jgi:GNAT superfamily N-acetyltransferase